MNSIWAALFQKLFGEQPEEIEIDEGATPAPTVADVPELTEELLMRQLVGGGTEE